MKKHGILPIVLIIASIWIQDTHAQNKERANYWTNDAKRVIRSILQTTENQGTAKNVVLFVADGLDLNTISIGRADIGEESTYNFENFPDVGMSKTYCVDQQVPDAACATSGMLSGIKTKQDLVGLNPKAKAGDCSSAPGKRMTSLVDWAAAAGKRTGIVTTSDITSPSVAPAYAHSASSMWQSDVDINMYNAQPCNDIARQLIEGKTNNRFNVLFGGGTTSFLPNTTTDPVTGVISPLQRQDGFNGIDTWLAEKSNRGKSAEFVYNSSALNAIDPATTEYALGLFNTEELSDSDPTLSDMVKKALSILEQGTDGYFLLVETSRIRAKHEMNLPGLAAAELQLLDEAVSAVTQDNETLIIVAGLRGTSVKLTAQNDLGGSPFGLVSGDSPTDSLPRTYIQYSTGVTFADPRTDYSSSSFDSSSVAPSCVGEKMQSPGGQDVPVYATGPMSYLFRNVHEQHYIAHAASYAMCAGLYKRCVYR